MEKRGIARLLNELSEKKEFKIVADGDTVGYCSVPTPKRAEVAAGYDFRTRNLVAPGRQSDERKRKGRQLVAYISYQQDRNKG